MLVFVLIACKSDPNKQIEEGTIAEGVFHSEEIGWTMEIPKGWEITDLRLTNERTERGMEALVEDNGLAYDSSGLKQLLNFQKDMFHVFQSTTEPFELEYEGEYEDNGKFLRELIFDTYTAQGIKVDSSSSKVTIDKIEFQVFHLKLYGPDGKLFLNQDMYSSLINGLDFGVNLSYINEEDKDEMLEAWMNSKFDK